MDTKQILELANEHSKKARTLVDFYTGHPMPQEVADKIEMHIKTSDGLPEHLATPHPKFDRFAAVGPPGAAIDNPGALMSKDAPRLAPEQKVRDWLGLGKVDEEAILGWIGHQVKAAVQPVDYAETAQWNKHIGMKDM